MIREEQNVVVAFVDQYFPEFFCYDYVREEDEEIGMITPAQRLADIERPEKIRTIRSRESTFLYGTCCSLFSFFSCCSCFGCLLLCQAG